jgi:hypothetical protein
MPVCPRVLTAAVLHAAATGYAVGAPTEADFIRWIGVATGILGALVVALAALDLLWFQTRQLPRRVDDLLCRLYGGPEPARVVGVSAMAMAGMSISAEGTVSPPADAPLDVLVRHLMQEMDALRDRVRKQERKQQADHDGLSERVNKIDIDTRASLQALAARTEEERHQDIRLAARALPLIILGIILTSVPDGLAAVGWLGWALAGISGVLALWLGVWTAGAWLWRRVRHS